MNRATLAPTQGDTEVSVAEYVCGLLGAEERAQVHHLLSQDDQALTQALAWEERLLALVDALPRVEPAAAVRERLQGTLGIDPPPAFMPPPKPLLLQRESQDISNLPQSPLPPPVSVKRVAPLRKPPKAAKAAKQHTPAPERQAASAQPEPAAQPDLAAHRILVRKLWFWRLIGLCSTVAAITGIMLPGPPPPAPVQVIKVAPTRAAILQAPGTSSTPGWTATLDPHGNLVMQPLVRTEIPTGNQALLWTRSERVPEPRLLGRIDPNRPVQVSAASLGALADDQILEITQERDEDAAKGIPHGPVLFIGQMTIFGSDAASTSAGAQRGGAAPD